MEIQHTLISQSKERILTTYKAEMMTELININIQAM